MLEKYFKPNSVSWWASVAPLSLGLFMAGAPIHELYQWVEFAQNATGMKAPVLINAGIAGIGLRGAINA
jgi:hypothetical protein